MLSMYVQTMERWLELASRFEKHDYRVSYYQHGIEDEEGMHVGFWSTGKEDVEIVTHSKEIKKAVFQYSHDHR